MNHQRDLSRRRHRKAECGFKKIKVRSDRARLCVYRSNTSIYAQVIDDRAGKTVAAASSRDKALPAAPAELKGKVGVAAQVGLLIAERAKKAGIDSVVFDRRHYRYHGRIKALADAARKGGLSF